MGKESVASVKDSSSVLWIDDGWGDSKEYWIASRYANIQTTGGGLTYVNFGILHFNLRGGIQSDDYSYLYDSYEGSDEWCYAIRPVVDIPLSNVSLGKTGSGVISSPYGLTDD